MIWIDRVTNIYKYTYSATSVYNSDGFVLHRIWKLKKKKQSLKEGAHNGMAGG